MNDKVSIIMSTYNTPTEYLECAINSILNQTYQNIEFIIVCDGCKEDYDIIKKYKDKRIKVIYHSTNQGLASSLNEAIEVSTGKYIARMDSDDISLKNRIKTQVEFMMKNSNIKICGMYCKCFGDKKNVNNLFLNKPNEIQIQLLYRACFAHPTIMMEKDYMVKNKLKYNNENRYAEDFELWSKMVSNDNAYIIPKFGVYYRIHNGQTTISKRELQVQLTKNIIDNNIKKYYLDNICNINNVMYVLGELEPLDKNNYLQISDDIDKIISYNTVLKPKVLKKVLFNRYFQIILKSKDISILDMLKKASVLRKSIKIYNIINLFFVVKYKIVIKLSNI